VGSHLGDCKAKTSTATKQKSGDLLPATGEDNIGDISKVILVIEKRKFRVPIDIHIGNHTAVHAQIKVIV
jgi:hypothetical protein